MRKATVDRKFRNAIRYVERTVEPRTPQEGLERIRKNMLGLPLPKRTIQKKVIRKMYDNKYNKK